VSDQSHDERHEVENQSDETDRRAGTLRCVLSKHRLSLAWRLGLREGLCGLRRCVVPNRTKPSAATIPLP
jgi:hypothetical protein